VSGQGHNSAAPVAHQQLRSLVERIERLNEEKATVQQDIAEVYAECKAFGFDKKIVRKVVQIRSRDNAERQEEEALLDLYMGALGMLPANPEDDAVVSGSGMPGLTRPESPPTPAGAPEAVNAADATCKPVAAGCAPQRAVSLTGEAGEAATDQQKPTGPCMELPPSPPGGADGAAGVDDTPAPAATNVVDMPDIPSFMRRAE
jgi:uncharacterized protein (UPF0335 family)